MLEQNMLKYLFKTKDGQLFSKKTGKRLGSVGAGGYRTVSINGKSYREHRVIWMLAYGTLPKKIDHINGIRDDNRLKNLREVTDSQNSHNSGRKRAAHGFKGIYLHSKRKKWYAKITVDGLVSSKGFYDTPIEAAKAYDLMAKEKLGTHANLNFPVGPQALPKPVRKEVVPGKKRISTGTQMQLKMNQ